MRVQLVRQRLILALAVLGLATATAFWGRGKSLSQATAEPPSAATTAPTSSTPQPAASSDYAQRNVAYIHNTVPITREQFGEYLIARQGADRLPNFVNKCIIEYASQQKGITVTDAEVEADFAATLKGLGNVTSRDFVAKVLKPYNKTLYEWKEDVIKPRILLTKMCRDHVQVTDEDLRLAFEAYYGEKVDCRMIMWPHSERHLVFNSIYGKIRDSEAEFERAATHQASQMLAAKGGRMEPIGHNTTGNEELEKAAFALQPGELSRVLDTPQGLVVLKCVQRLAPNKSKKLEEVRDQLSKEVFDKKLQREIPQYFKELSDQAQPKLLLKHQFTEDELVREVQKELQSDSAKKGAHSPPAAN
jgi:parvulin-like peptidyl-prolyl isomerase